VFDYEVADLLVVGVMQGFALAREVLDGFDRRFGETVMSLLGATDDGKIFRAGHPFVSVGVIESDTDQVGSGCGQRSTHTLQLIVLPYIASLECGLMVRWVETNDNFSTDCRGGVHRSITSLSNGRPNGCAKEFRALAQGVSWTLEL
jgi:hypothetical protein